jgi:hypothetical protein
MWELLKLRESSQLFQTALSKMSNESKKPSRLLSYGVIFLAAILGIAVAHVVYFLDAYFEGEKFVAANPGGRYVIHYGNLPHMQALLYGVLGGAIVGAILAWALDFFMKKKDRPAPDA